MEVGAASDVVVVVVVVGSIASADKVAMTKTGEGSVGGNVVGVVDRAVVGGVEVVGICVVVGVVEGGVDVVVGVGVLVVVVLGKIVVRIGRTVVRWINPL